MSSFATAVGVGLLGVLAGVPARAVIQRLAGPPAAAQAGRRWPGIAPAMGLRWFAVTLRLAGQGLGGAVAASLALAFVCLVLAVIGRRHRAAAQPHHLPGVPGGGRAAAGRQPRPGPSLAGSVAACSRRPRSAGCSRCWLRTAWGWRCQAGPDLGPGAGLAVVGTVAVGWWPASCSAAWRGWAACWHLAC